jgi:hypothetical protein
MVQVDVICDDTHNLTEMFNDGRLDLAITTENQKSDYSIELNLVWIMYEMLSLPDYEELPLALFHSKGCYCANALAAPKKEAGNTGYHIEAPALPV